MKPEYVRFSKEESVYSQKNILESQIHAIALIKAIYRYKKARIEELLIKIQLKEIIEKIKNNVNYLDRLLPNSEFIKDNLSLPLTIENKHQMSKNIRLEQELDSIKSRLSNLSNKFK